MSLPAARCVINASETNIVVAEKLKWWISGVVCETLEREDHL